MASPQLIPRAREIFEAAIEREHPDARSTYVRQACGADAQLLEHVLELLKANDLAEVFLPDAPPESWSGPGLGEKPGDRVGRYLLLEELGAGGCGVVFLAEQQEPVRRRAALKVIKLGMDTKAVVARFEAERQALAMMDHPNIAKVFEAGTTETGRPFFAMELVQGSRITDYCTENRLPPRERLLLFVQVCHALQHAHQKGILHRDIKPSNVLVTRHDELAVPKVIDFGIAKAMDASGSGQTCLTPSQGFVGTPAYMSPEQAESGGLNLDTRTDIYSLGVLLYELLTGETPFDASALLRAGLDELRRTIREVVPVRPSTRVWRRLLSADSSRAAFQPQEDNKELAQILKGDLDWIVMKCIEKDRTRRYETANGLAQDVRRFLANEPVLARPPSRWYSFRKLVRRNQGTFVALAAITLLLVLGAGLSSWQAVRASKAEQLQRQLRQRAERNEQAARQAREQARRRAYTSDMRAAASALSASNFGQAVDLLRRYFPQDGEPDLRGLEWRYLWQASRGDEILSIPHSHFVNCVRYSPDGRFLVTTSFGGEARLIETATTKLQAIFSVVAEKDMADLITFSADGKWLALCGPQGVVVRDTTDWTIQHEWPGLYSGITFSSDSQTLAALHDSGLRLFQISTWQPFGEIHWPTSSAGQLSFVGNRHDLAILRRTGSNVELWDAAKQQKTADFGGIEVPAAMTVSPDGRWLAVGNAAGELLLWDLEAKSRVLIQKAHSRWLSGLAFSPDSRTLATGGGDQVIHLWDLSTISAGQLTQRATLKGHRNELWSLAFSPDGASLASGSKDRTAKVWRTDPPATSSIPLTVPGGTLALGFVPNTNQFLMFSPEGHLQLWDVLHAQLLRTIPIQPLGAVLFDPPYVDFGTTNGAVETWTIPAGERLSQKQLTDDPLNTLRVSPDRKFILGWDRNHDVVALWNFETGQRLTTFSDFVGPVAPGSWSKSQRAAFSPVGRWLAYATTNHTVKIWDLEKQAERFTLRGHTWHIECLLFSPDGSRLASGSWDAEARLWDPNTGTEVLSPLKGHLSGIASLSFSPDGRTLAVRSGEDLHFWSVLNGGEMLTIPNVTAWFFNIIAPDGNALIWEEGAFTGRFRIHQLPTLAEIDRHKLGRF